MNGFFSQEEFLNSTKIDQSTTQLMPECGKCGLHLTCNFPKMDFSGRGNRKVLIIGEAPGHQEDQVGEQFVGESGILLNDTFKPYGINIHHDCWKINAVNCYPKKTPTRAQIKYCKPYVDSVINKLKPEFIFLVGGRAVESYYMGRFKRLGITRWRGSCFPDKNTWVIPMLHPAFILRNPSANIKSVFERDVKFAADCLNKKPFEPQNYDSKIVLCFDELRIFTLLNEIIQNPPEYLYFDYETNTLKPHASGAQVVSISLNMGDKSYAFPYQYRHYLSLESIKAIHGLWGKILTHPKIKLQAQNLKFEDNWSRIIFGVTPTMWDWDTMIATHILDNRRAITGLKFQTYKEFGVEPYDKFISKQNMQAVPLKELLTYNAKDTLFGRMLAERQKTRMTKNLMKAYRFFHEGLLALADVQMTGMRLDEEHYNNTKVIMTRQIKDLTVDLMHSKEAKQFKEVKGWTLSLTSNKDLGYLFNDVMGVKTDLTDKGNYIVDKKTLERIKGTFVKDLLKMRKLDKIVGTYLAQFIRENEFGKIYPFFDLHIPVSYRGSSSRPNFQNIPVRDEDAKAACRKGLFASPGNQILEVDYKAIEVCISACYHKDPKMIEYITDPTTDMHRDAAVDIWGLKPEKITEDMRFYAKNCWVFPQFYGSYYAECAKDLWSNCIDLPLNPLLHKSIEGVGKVLLEASGGKYKTLRDRLRDLKITNIHAFADRLHGVEDKFWKRFKVYDQWKKEINKKYRQSGYVETYLGFKCKGIMSPNDATNYQIQGTSFHCLLWLLIKINEIRKIEKWKTKIMGQIHDSIVFDLYPPEKDHVLKTVRQVGTQDILEEFPWIIVPLTIDAEITPIDGSWYDKEKIK